MTAHDERLLLDLNGSSTRMPVLGRRVADLRLALIAQVIPAQRWGIPAGARRPTVHVKNGWLPLATRGWRIHSIGCFTGHPRGYLSVGLTEDDPTMGYGITTIQRAAEVINHQLNPAATGSRPSRPAPSWGTPDEQIPPSLGGRNFLPTREPSRARGTSKRCLPTWGHGEWSPA